MQGVNTEPITEIPVGQTRNHNLVVQFLRGGYFDSEIDAWRAARRLGLEIDLMTAEETTSDAVDPNTASFKRDTQRRPLANAGRCPLRPATHCGDAHRDHRPDPGA